LSEYRNTLDMLGALGTLNRIAWQCDRFVTLLDAHGRHVMRVAALPAPLHLLPSIRRCPRFRRPRDRIVGRVHLREAE
jgi:hypothetical protein